MNSISVIGRLAADPDTKYLESGKVVCKFRVAVSRPYSDKTDWFFVELWGKTAEIATNYCRKGSQVGISGYLRVDEWEKDKAMHTTHVIAGERLTLIGSKKEGQQSDDEAPQPAAEARTRKPATFRTSTTAADEDFADIPF